MVRVLYEIPLPNDGTGYKFTEEELVELLDKVYDKGRMDERELQMSIIENVATKSISNGVWITN